MPISASISEAEAAKTAPASTGAVVKVNEGPTAIGSVNVACSIVEEKCGVMVPP